MSTTNPANTVRPERSPWLAKEPRRKVKSFELPEITSRRKSRPKPTSTPVSLPAQPPPPVPPTSTPPPDGELTATFLGRVPNDRMALIRVDGKNAYAHGPHGWAEVFNQGQRLAVRYDGKRWVLVGQYSERGIRLRSPI